MGPRMTPIPAIFTLLVLATAQRSGLDKKWVWGEGQRSTGFGQDRLRGEYSVAKPLIGGPNGGGVPLFQAADNPRTDAKFFRDSSLKEGLGRPRYEVFEGDGIEPISSGGAYPVLPVRPPPDGRPPGPLPPPISRPPLPLPASRPPPNPDAGILTGPVPSWERPPPPKNGDPTSFDSCKCVHSFNCKSPALQFGSCDVGKQYCCTNNPGYGFPGPGGPGGFGSKYGPNDDIRPVLAGPGGPIDKIRPDFPGLVGNRPPIRPGGLFNGGPPPNPFDFYGRSNNIKKNR